MRFLREQRHASHVPVASSPPTIQKRAKIEAIKRWKWNESLNSKSAACCKLRESRGLGTFSEKKWPGSWIQISLTLHHRQRDLCQISKIQLICMKFSEISQLFFDWYFTFRSFITQLINIKRSLNFHCVADSPLHNPSEFEWFLMNTWVRRNFNLIKSLSDL